MPRPEAKGTAPMTRKLFNLAIEAQGDRPLLAGPLAELAYRLRIEVQYGRNAGQQAVSPLPGVAPAALAAFRSNPQAN